jgi:hypothetical protein
MYNQTCLNCYREFVCTCPWLFRNNLTCCVSILVDLCNSLDRFDCTYPWFFRNNLTCCVSILVDLCNSLDRFDGTDPWLFINNLYMLCVKNQGYVQSNLSILLQRSTSIDTQHVQVVSKEPRVCTIKPV